MIFCNLMLNIDFFQSQVNLFYYLKYTYVVKFMLQRFLVH